MHLFCFPGARPCPCPLNSGPQTVWGCDLQVVTVVEGHMKTSNLQTSAEQLIWDPALALQLCKLYKLNPRVHFSVKTFIPTLKKEVEQITGTVTHCILVATVKVLSDVNRCLQRFLFKTSKEMLQSEFMRSNNASGYTDATSLTSAEFWSCHRGHSLTWWLCSYFSRKVHNSCLMLLALVLACIGNRHQIPLMWNRFKGDPIPCCIKFRQLCLYSKGILNDFQEVLLKGLRWE